MVWPLQSKAEVAERERYRATRENGERVAALEHSDTDSRLAL